MRKFSVDTCPHCNVTMNPMPVVYVFAVKTEWIECPQCRFGIGREID